MIYLTRNLNEETVYTERQTTKHTKQIVCRSREPRVRLDQILIGFNVGKRFLLSVGNLVFNH